MGFVQTFFFQIKAFLKVESEFIEKKDGEFIQDKKRIVCD